MFYTLEITDSLTGETNTCIIQVLENGVRSWWENQNNSYNDQYLAWLAEGNTPEEWQPDIVQSNETP